MDIKKPTPPIQTAYAENNTNNNNFYECLTGVVDAVGGMAEYSTTPVQVGTWVDGSPVYRAAIDVVCADVDATTYSAMLSVNGVEYTHGDDAIRVINSHCVYEYTEDDSVYLVDCSYEYGNKSAYFILSGFVSLPEDQTDCTSERFIGFVEYIVISND